MPCSWCSCSGGAHSNKGYSHQRKEPLAVLVVLLGHLHLKWAQTSDCNQFRSLGVQYLKHDCCQLTSLFWNLSAFSTSPARIQKKYTVQTCQMK